MRRNVCSKVLVLGVLIIAVFSTIVCGAEKPKAIVLTTLDIKDSYKVIGIVSYRSNSISFNELIDGVKKAAKDLNADAVIGLRCVAHVGCIYAYGTAVSIEK